MDIFGRCREFWLDLPLRGSVSNSDSLMNALSITLLLAVPALMLVIGEITKWLVIGRRSARHHPVADAVPVREVPAADSATTRVA